MKKTRLSRLLLLVLTLLCSIFILASCGGNVHTHNYSNEWSKDGTYHWQACSGCEETRNKAEHDWNSGIVTLQPTETSEGMRTFTCNTCGHTKVESIPELDVHEHTFAESWTSNESHHWHAATCEHATEKSGEAEHHYGTDSVCDVCEYDRTVRVLGVTLDCSSITLIVDEVKDLIATVTPNNATNQSLTWTTSNNSIVMVDANGKVMAAGVGTAIITVTTVDGNKTAQCMVVVSAKVCPHATTRTERENEVDSTCKEIGAYDEVVYCSTCGDELSRTEKTIAKKETHTEGETVQENFVDSTIEEKGSYDNVVYCSVCGKELIRTTIIIPEKKQIPVYQGMTITGTNSSTLNLSVKNYRSGGIMLLNSNNGNNGNHYGHYKGDCTDDRHDVDKNNPYPDNDENIEDEIRDSLEVIGSTKEIYYTTPNQYIYINIHISNPDKYEILSFTLNGEKYSSYMFEQGSTLETLILKVNVGNVSGIVEYTIDQIKYVDGTEIKDVKIDGEKTVKAGVKIENQVTADISNVTIGTNGISLSAKITDNDALLAYSNGAIKAVLYDGEQLIATKDIVLGNNSVVFDMLTTNRIYQYAIVAFYDDLSGNGVESHILSKNAFSTNAAVLFDNITVGKTGVTFGFKWDESATNKALTSLKLYQGETLVKNLTVGATSVDELLSGEDYTLIAEYTDLGNTERIVLEFTTFTKEEYVISIVNPTQTQTSVGFEIRETDADNVGAITKIELYKDNQLVKEAGDIDARSFDGLLSNTTYVVKVTYTYNLNDGLGDKITYKTLTITTNAKATPVVSIINPTKTQTGVGFEIVETDEDIVGAVTKIELYKGNQLVKEAENFNVRSFDGLLSNTTYTVKITYTYDLNDGAGEQTAYETLDITTNAKTTPIVEIINIRPKDVSVSFDIVRNDPDAVITKIVAGIFLNDSKISEKICNNSCSFDELLYSTEYTIQLTISYDLSDGVGSRTIKISTTTTTENYTDSQGFVYVFNSDQTVFVKSYVGTEKELTVPSSVLGYTITGICENAFAKTGITSIVIPSTVNTIGAAAFNGCNKLESITLPFVGGTHNTIESSTSTLFGFVFGTSSYDGGVATTQYCKYTAVSSSFFTSISFSSPITYYIPESLKSVTVTGGAILCGAFMNCSNITHIYIGEGISEIGVGAFWYCENLQKVDLSNSITDLGMYAFTCCKSLTEIVLPSNIIRIHDGCFDKCNNLSQIYFPEGVYSIGNYAFSGCSALKSIVIPKSVCVIGFCAFGGCDNLESITLPFIGNSIDDINENTYFGFIFGANSYMEHDRYYGYDYIPEGLKEVIITGARYEDYNAQAWLIDEYAFYSCQNIEKIVIGDSFEKIGDCAFQNCTGLRSITFTGETYSLSIGDEAFESCWVLTNVYINKGNNPPWTTAGTENEQLINANTFFYYETDPALKCLEGDYWHYVDGIETPWPKYVSPVSEGLAYKFTYQPDYDNIIAGIGTCKDSVIYIPTIAPNRWGMYFDIIGEKAFQGCSQITEVVIPKNINQIRAYAFADCTNLTTIKYRGTEEEWNSIIKGEGWDDNTNFTVIFNYIAD